MYARLCRKLSEGAPNFEPEGSQACTYNRLLLKKCQDEFECRRKATEVWDRSDKFVLTAEEEEQRSAARRKMVGNLRFIGELGKLEIIKGDILHNCIQQLLEKKRHQTLVDLAEDVECLCQMMRTCGKLLDNTRGKFLMDQYFERMVQLSEFDLLPTRIRFMLRDSIELRAADWVPRKVAQQDGPKTIQQVREEAARDLGVYIPPPNAEMRSNGPLSPLPSMPPFFPQGCNRTGMEDVFGAPPLGAVSLGTGPGVISSQPDKFSYEANGFSNNANARDQGYRQRSQQGGNNFNSNNFYPNKHFSVPNFSRQNVQNNQTNYNNATAKDLPPRFMKIIHGRSNGNGSKADDVSLRPTSSMMPKSRSSGLMTHGAQGGMIHLSGDPYSTMPIAAQPPNQKPTPPLMRKDPPIIIKQAPIDKAKANKKDKGLSKVEYMQKLSGILDELLKNQTVDEAVAAYKAVKIPERFVGESVRTILQTLLSKEVSDSGREIGGTFLLKLRTDNFIGHNKMIDGIKDMLNLLESLMADLPRAKPDLATILSPLMSNGSVTLADIADLDNGQHYLLFFLILQSLHKSQGKTGLLKFFNDSKVNLLQLLPEADRTKEKLADLLDDKDLTFLSPLLRIQSDLWDALLDNPSPHVFYKYIKSNLDEEHHTAPSFVIALFTVLIKYITKESTLQPNMDVTTSPDKITTEKEKDLLNQFKPVLLAFLHDRVKLQVVALYALQVFAFTMTFPKGMLVRWFVNLYDLEIIEEESFITWKEDINQDYAGKGKALFQVNQWLTWLQETEEDEEEENEM